MQNVWKAPLRSTILKVLILFALSPSNGLALDPCGGRFVVPPDVLLLEAGWQCAHQAEEIRVYERKIPDSKIHEVAAISIIHAPMPTIARLISDYAGYPQFMPYVTRSDIESEANGQTWVFQQLAFPFPISNRFYTIRLGADASRSKEGIFRLSWQLADPNHAARKGTGEPVLINHGFWKLEAIGEGRDTHVTYFVHTDPGGALPSWVVNLANQAAVPKVIDAVRRKAIARN